MRYGLPYKGSKNAIARWIISQLPKSKYFIDLFFGGGAVTHCAMLSGKYERFIVNDIDGRLPKLFVECAYGKHTVDTHTEWVSREEFNAKKNDDAYIALVWSFGNNGIDYIYGADIEDFKRAYHKAVYDDDVSYLKPYGYNIVSSHKQSVYARYLEFNRQIKEYIEKPQLEVISRQTEIERLQSLQSLQRLQSLQSLQRLQSLQSLQRLQSLQSLQSDYEQVLIPQNALIYCDPPYKSTNCGKYKGFDSKRFYKWAEMQSNIFISEYDMPPGFIPIAETEKTVLSAANGNSQKSVERLFTNQKTWDNLNSDYKLYYTMNLSKQIKFYEE